MSLPNKYIQKVTIMSFFKTFNNQGAQSAQQKGSGRQTKKKQEFLSAFRGFEGKPYSKLYLPKDTMVIARLVPTFGPLDTDHAINVVTVAVKTLDEHGNPVWGKILAGKWWDAVNRWLMENYKSRLFGKDRGGDINLKPKGRVLFWASALTSPAEGEDAQYMLRLVELPGRNYPKQAYPGIGTQFLPGGKYYADFDPVGKPAGTEPLPGEIDPPDAEGRAFRFRAFIKDQSDAMSKTFEITPTRTHKPLVNSDGTPTEIFPELLREWQASGRKDLPSLVDHCRNSSPEEIRSAVCSTLPADVAEAFNKKFSDSDLTY